MEYHLPQIPGIDWEKAHRYLPTKQMLTETLGEFVRSAAKQTELLIEYRQAVLREPTTENYTAFRIQAHAMKSALRSIGADLFEPAFALETAGREEDPVPIREKTESFIGEYLALTDRLKAITGEDKAKEAFYEPVFFERLYRLKAAMDAFDIATLQETFRKIAAMDIPHSYKEQMVRLETAVRDLDSEQLEECCDHFEELKTQETK